MKRGLRFRFHPLLLIEGECPMSFPDEEGIEMVLLVGDVAENVVSDELPR